MNREDRKALEAYVQALLSEREKYLYQHALNKVRVITRSMKSAEKEEYLCSDAFRNTLRQVQRRDRVYQGLRRGELVQSRDLAEFDRLERMIARELCQDHPVDLAFLRTVDQSRVSLEKAHQALQMLREGVPRQFFSEEIGRLTAQAENRVVLWLRTGDQTGHPEEAEDGERSVVRRVLERKFPGGLTMKAVNRAFQPGSLESFLRGELSRAYPVLADCRNIRTPSGETVATVTRREADRGGALIMNALGKKFPRERIRRLLERNPGLIRLQKDADEAAFFPASGADEFRQDLRGHPAPPRRGERPVPGPAAPAGSGTV